jgi:hypothetical protein
MAFPVPDPNLPETQLYDRLRIAIQHLARHDTKEIERAFKSVLDTAMFRIDPWLTALPWRRAPSLAARNPRHLLGLYGWLDHPAPGHPGPTDGGLLHAPSHAQVLTAAILRDRVLSDPEADRWKINLDSRLVRLANRMANNVRLGMHIQEVLGREVERIVADPDAIKKLRGDFPIRQEHKGRRVCNGQTVLAADVTQLELPAGQVDALKVLQQAVDVYGDLLVSEAVYHVVNGRAEIASAAMDAAAGLAQPPRSRSSRRRAAGAVRAPRWRSVCPKPPPPQSNLIPARPNWPIRLWQPGWKPRRARRTIQLGNGR